MKIMSCLVVANSVECIRWREWHRVIATIDSRIPNLPTRIRSQCVVFRIFETRELALEIHSYNTRCALTMLGDDDLRLSTIVREAIFTLQNTIIFWAMQKDHHISILLDGTRLT